MRNKKLNNKMFPFVFGRICSFPLAMIKEFERSNCYEAKGRLMSSQKTLIENKDILIDYLYQLLPTIKDITLSKKIINLKRDVFNDKSIVKYKGIFENEIPLEVLKYMDAYKMYFENKKHFKDIYYTELYDSVLKLKDKSDYPFFKNGMLFSSWHVKNNIEKNNFKFNKLNAKNKRIIKTATNYIFRSMVKTSPFSSLNSIFCLESKGDYYKCIQPKYTTNIQISNLIFYQLREFLLSNKEYRLSLIVTRNQSVSFQKKEIKFYSNVGNNEYFRKIGRSGIVNYISTYLTENSVSLKELILEIQNKVNEEFDTVLNYVEQLIDSKFIVLQFPLNPHDSSWSENFLNLNNTEGNNAVKKVNALVKNIVATKNKIIFSNTAEEREKFILGIFHDLISFYEKMEIENKTIKNPNDIFYEDCSSIQPIELEKNAISDLISEFKKLRRIIPKVNLKTIIHKEIIDRMKAEEVIELSILDAYERIFLNLNLDLINRVYHFFDENQKELKAKILEDMDLTDLNIENYMPRLITSLESDPFSFYFQFIDTKQKKIVLNGFSSGYAKSISRFLNNYDERVVNKITKYIDENVECDFVDVKDASIHNVNIYPPLSKYAISLSDDKSLKRYYDLINLNDLVLKLKEDKLSVINKNTGEELNLYSFSLEGISRNSKLLLFLNFFNPSGFTDDITFLLMYISNMYLERQHVKLGTLFIPRISFGEKIVLQRAKWIVTSKEFDDIRTLDSNNELDIIYLYLSSWFEERKIPNKCFVKLASKGNQSQDKNKPFYFNIEIPVLCLSLFDFIKKNRIEIEFSELLPNFNDIQSSHISEYIVNVI